MMRPEEVRILDATSHDVYDASATTKLTWAFCVDLCESKLASASHEHLHEKKLSYKCIRSLGHIDNPYFWWHIQVPNALYRLTQDTRK